MDTNVLLYAANADDEAHALARELLERLAAGPDLLYLFWPTIMGFLRIATHPSIFPDPYTPEQAAAAIAGLLDRPNVRTPSEHDGFWELYRSTADHHARGNGVPDAHLATLMRQHRVSVIYTRDSDFRRYDGIDPFARPVRIGPFALRRDPHDIPRRAHLLQPEDQPPRRVELPAAQAVDGRARERVVVVVPRLAERGEREPDDVGRVVVGGEAPAAEEVADRVDRPGDVVHEEDPHEPAPEQRRSARRASVPRQREPSSERQREATQRRATGSARLMRRMPRSSIRSRRVAARGRACPCVSNSQPTCACQRPRSSAAEPGRRAGCAGRPPRR